MGIAANKIINTPKPQLRGDGKAHFKFYVDSFAGEPQMGDIVAWPGSDCEITNGHPSVHQQAPRIDGEVYHLSAYWLQASRGWTQ